MKEIKFFVLVFCVQIYLFQGQDDVNIQNLVDQELEEQQKYQMKDIKDPEEDYDPHEYQQVNIPEVWVSNQKKYQQVSKDFFEFEQVFRNCIDRINDVDYTKDNITLCVGKNFHKIINDTKFIKMKITNNSELQIKKSMLTHCYEPAGLNEVMANGCDVLERDILDLVWAEMNFYGIIFQHRKKYLFEYSKLPEDTLSKILKDLQLIYNEIFGQLNEIDVHQELIVMNVKQYISKRSIKIKKEIRKFETTPQPLKKRRTITIVQTIDKGDPLIDPRRIPRPIILDGSSRMYFRHQNNEVNQLIDNDDTPNIEYEPINITKAPVESKKYKSYLKGISDLISPVDQKKVIVIDIGSNYIRFGLSGQNLPIINLPFVIAKSKNSDSNDLTKTKLPDTFGNKTIQALEDKPGEYELIYPFIHYNEMDRKLQNLESYLKYVFEQILNVESSILDLLIVDSVNNDEKYRIKLMEMLFEGLRVASVNFVNSAVASLFLSGRTSGICFEFGNQSTNIVPIYEGFVMKHALQISPFGGLNSTELIQEELKNQKIDLLGKNLNSIQVIEKIKKKLSYVSFDYEEDIKPEKVFDIEETSFELPDGKIISLSNQVKFKSGEILLNPDLIVKGEKNQIDKIFVSIGKCESNLQKILANNIMLSGGSSMTNNLLQRIQRDVEQQKPKELGDLEFSVMAEAHRPFSSWIGASILGSISTFQNLKIKKSEFEENTEHKNTFLFKKIIC